MINLAKPQDVDRCADIFYRTVMKLAPSLYTNEQVLAWSKTALNQQKFTDYILNNNTFVYYSNHNQIVGFSGIESNGHIASLYVDPEYCRQGIATNLLKHIINYAQINNYSLLYAEASFFSKNVFLRTGFQITNLEYVKYNDVYFQRFRVELTVDN